MQVPRFRHVIWFVALAGVAAAPSLARAQSPAAPSDDSAPAFTWDARAVEHLLNRAGFGARGDDVAEGLKLGPQQLVARLFVAREAWREIEPQLVRWEDFGLDHRQRTLESSPFHTLGHDAAKGMCTDARLMDRDQFIELEERWLSSMIAHTDPLRDRMQLFWHGFFTTSYEVNKRKAELIHQFQWLRRGALESYADLLRGIVRDPAMLQYLDNVTNVKGHPNENLARELMEMFSLGEGRYTELDVREAARALSGYTSDPEGRFQFEAAAHDDGEKVLFGVRGKFDADELVEHLLAQEACPRWIARRLLTWFEGVEPEPARVDAYAKLLREKNFALRPFLEQLFLDPAFYRAEIRGARVQAPLEYLVGVCRKLRIEPPHDFLHQSSLLLGQCFYAPPNVKGWSEGLAWITSDSLLLRGNCVGILLGVLDDPMVHGLAASDDGAMNADDTGAVDMSMAASGADRAAAILPRLRRLADPGTWDSHLDLVGQLESAQAATDVQIVDWALEEWLAIAPPEETRAVVLAYLRAEREAAGIDEGALVEYGQANELVLRRLAHTVFSLPEAQLH